MKRVLFIVLATVAMSLFSCGCGSEADKKVEKVEKKVKRIKLKTNVVLSGYRYMIIEVDGIEYITTGDGAITELKVKPENK